MDVEIRIFLKHAPGRLRFQKALHSPPGAGGRLCRGRPLRGQASRLKAAALLDDMRQVGRQQRLDRPRGGVVLPLGKVTVGPVRDAFACTWRLRLADSAPECTRTPSKVAPNLGSNSD